MVQKCCQKVQPSYAVANASYTIALFANVLFVFICVCTLDSVHARLRLPFLTSQTDDRKTTDRQICDDIRQM